MRSSRLPLVLLVLGLVLSTATGAAPVDLPERLTDQEFWRLSQELSEPDGSFQSDNLLSNEIVFGRIVPELTTRATPGSVYIGVGPEQNFTYIAAMKPRMAFITDIRRGNLHVQLMYKALFELSKDRADFVSRLFTKPRPATLTASSTVLEIMNAYWDIFTANETAFQLNLAAVTSHLTRTRQIPLDQADLDGIAAVYRAFYWYGPGMTYSARTNLSTSASSRAGAGSYWAMMTQTDANGTPFSYLSSEERFAVVKDLQSRNLIVPVVGNFSGPKALRAVGTYVRNHNATVAAFYLSNVESYLQRDGSWGTFCANVATLPLDESSLFIRPSPLRIVGTSPSPFAAVSGQNTSGQATRLIVQGSGSFVIVSGQSRQTLGFINALPATIASTTLDSAALVPPRSWPLPSAGADDSMRPAGLVPITEAVAACAGTRSPQ